MQETRALLSVWTEKEHKVVKSKDLWNNAVRFYEGFLKKDSELIQISLENNTNQKSGFSVPCLIINFQHTHSLHTQRTGQTYHNYFATALFNLCCARGDSRAVVSTCSHARFEGLRELFL